MAHLAENKRIEELRDLLHRANHAYYIEAQPVISDREFDHLLQELAALEEKTGNITSDSPTRRIGGGITREFPVVSHPIAMLSLANTYNEQELRDFDKRVTNLLQGSQFTYFVELKFDGMALRLRYENGILVLGATRGDGQKGDDITINVRTIRDIPLKLRSPFSDVVEVRGEAYMETEAFRIFNQIRQEAGDQVFANPRNATAGTLKMQDSSIVAKRPLRFFAYDLVSDEMFDNQTHEKKLNQLKNMGLRVCPTGWVCNNIDEVLITIQNVGSERKSLGYDTDGVVIKVNEDKYRDPLGSTAKAPRWAVAYKFEPEQAITTIEDITLQVGRLGTITPVAELKPVTLAGTTVKRASLHNEDEIHRKDIRIGDQVVIEKAGEIIPQVINVVNLNSDSRREKYHFPARCPECNSNLVKYTGEVAWRCINQECAPQIRIRIEHFASRDAMDIDGLGESIVDQLVSAGIIKNYADLYDLSFEKLVNLDRMGEKSAENLIQSIQKSKEQPFDRILFALGIRFVGETVAKDLACEFGNLDTLMIANEDTLTSVNGIGPRIAESLVNFFSDPLSQAIIERLKNAGLRFKYDKIKKLNAKLDGKIFVLTGTLPKLSRSDAEQLIEDNGGKTSSSVSSKTDYILAGEAAGSKLEKGKKLGIKIIDESGFFNLINA